MHSYQILTVTISTALIQATLASPSYAQDNVNTPAQSIDQFEVDVEAGVTLSEEFTSNVFLTANDQRSDFVTVLSPWADVAIRSGDLRLSFGARAEIGRFADNSSEDYENYTLDGAMRYDLGGGTFVFGGVEHTWDHEDRDSPDDVNGLEPTKFTDANAYFGIGGRLNGNTYRFGVNVRELDFDDTLAAGAVTFNNDDRDRLETEIGGRIGVAQLEGGEVFVQGIYDRRSYDAATDDLGFARSSDGFQGAVGYSGSVGNLSGEITGGFIRQDFDDVRFSTVTIPDFGIDLTWRPGLNTRVTGVVSRTLEETTASGASSYVSTSAGARLRHRIAQDLSLAGYFFLTENDYRGIDRRDTLAETGVGLRYHLNPNLYLDTNYAFTKRLSDVAGADYDEHRLELMLGLDLQPAFQAQPGAQARFNTGEFYAGAQIGQGFLQSKVDGPRGGGGNLTADFGDQGPVAGILGGYRTSFGNLVLGAEADIEFGSMEWAHDADRDFSVRTGNTIGLSAIVGVRTASRSLVYGRFGAFSSEFESRYERAGTIVTKDDRETGFSVGVGTEIPLARGLSARIEYQIRSFSDYELGAPLNPASNDNFANLQGAARFGLIYLIGAKDEIETPVQPVDFSGFYAGGMLGHGTIQSDNSGPRPTGVAPAFILDVTRSGQGFSGAAVAGYGQQFGNLYLGAEAELELSTAGWNIERSPTGRSYSVEKQHALNAMLRVGYVMNNAVLFYGRAGYSRGKFETDYSYAGTVVDQSDTLSGIRIGAGVEFAMSPRTRLRMEYTYTDYGSHQVDYGSGIDRFDTSENLFQVGLVYRF
jgi:opacity protein-like surface antigen